MKVVRTYKLRSQAEEAANFLMSKGIASNVHGSDILRGFGSLSGGSDGVELEVQDSTFEKADELLNQKENGFAPSLPGLDFFSIGKKKKK